MATKSDADVIRRNGAAHVALLIMKMMRRPVAPDEFTDIAVKKLSKRHRMAYLERLAKYGYATKTADEPPRFKITRRGIDKIAELTVPKTRNR